MWVITNLKARFATLQRRLLSFIDKLHSQCKNVDLQVLLAKFFFVKNKILLKEVVEMMGMRTLPLYNNRR